MFPVVVMDDRVHDVLVLGRISLSFVETSICDDVRWSDHVRAVEDLGSFFRIFAGRVDNIESHDFSLRGFARDFDC